MKKFALAICASYQSPRFLVTGGIVSHDVITRKVEVAGLPISSSKHRLLSFFKRASGLRRSEVRQAEKDDFLKRAKEGIAVLELCRQNNSGVTDYKVFSQNGEDGILYYLVNELGLERASFVEFGFDVTENNTLLHAARTRCDGLYIDGSVSTYERASQLYGELGINAKVATSWLEAESINRIISGSALDLEAVSILSIDVDGTDFWLWAAITCVKPIIVITEYNASFGKEKAVTIPYRRDFERDTSGYNGIYHGMSLSAAHRLAQRKGYSLFCCDESGLNAFWVRNDRLTAGIRPKSVDAAFRPHSRRLEALNQQRQEEIALSYPLLDVSSDASLDEAIREITLIASGGRPVTS